MLELLLFIAGFGAGAINAVAGGGVMLTFGTLLYAGLAPLAAAATSIATVGPGSIAAAYGYRKDLASVDKRYYIFLLPTVIGTTIGATLLVNTSHETFESIVPWLILVSVLLFAFQPQLHKHIHKPAHLRIKSPLLLVCLALLLISIYGGYFGSGFGFIVLALLGFTHLKTIYQINGMKNIISAVIVTVCAVVFASANLIEWHYVIYPLLGSALGGYIGAKIGHHISPHVTRIVVITIGLTICVMLFGKLH